MHSKLSIEECYSSEDLKIDIVVDIFVKVALKWSLSKGSSVIVKSFNSRRMKENMGAMDLNLDDQDLLDIEKMEERKVMRAEFLTNGTSSPYRNIMELWDDEI